MRRALSPAPSGAPMLRSTLLVALAAAGCATSRTDAPAGLPSTPPEATTGVPAEAGAPVRIELGEAVQINGTAVRFAAVEEDSRCPENTTCVWEGRARVRLLVAAEPVVLTLPHGGAAQADEPAEATLAGLTVEVLALRPFPGSTAAQGGAPAEVEVIARRSNG